MVDLISERRMVENEVVFRQHNEQVQRDFDELKEVATQEGQASLIKDSNLLLHFYCECADENCRKRIVIKLSEYKDIHKIRDQFVVLPGHEVTAIERIIRKEHQYIIVQKLLDPPEIASKLYATDIDNA